LSIWLYTPFLPSFIRILPSFLPSFIIVLPSSLSYFLPSLLTYGFKQPFLPPPFFPSFI
jgi:hypothetical protein